MAEGILKKRAGRTISALSVGVENDLQIDGLAFAVCAENSVELIRDGTRCFDERAKGGEELDSFDLAVPLSPARQRRALALTRGCPLPVEYRSTLDPTPIGQSRHDKPSASRQARNQFADRQQDRFGAKRTSA
ncbi:low molecular weight phosphatase family protein [Poseidonocella sedimentorum]|nr:low molecular weight phosphatase family protein [Poseidonocella sedimentorum]